MAEEPTTKEDIRVADLIKQHPAEVAEIVSRAAKSIRWKRRPRR